MRLYMEITRDKYEFPIAIADSPTLLAEMCGVSANSVSCSCSLYRRGKYKSPRFISVEVDDFETE